MESHLGYFNWNNNKEAGTICFEVRIQKKKSYNWYGTNPSKLVESDDIHWALECMGDISFLNKAFLKEY